MSFAPGDLVRLKSGGSLMTVESVGPGLYSQDDMVFCVWSELQKGRTEIMRDSFPPITLVKSEKPKPTSRLARG